MGIEENIERPTLDHTYAGEGVALGTDGAPEAAEKISGAFRVVRYLPGGEHAIIGNGENPETRWLIAERCALQHTDLIVRVTELRVIGTASEREQVRNAIVGAGRNVSWKTRDVEVKDLADSTMCMYLSNPQNAPCIGRGYCPRDRACNE